MMKGNDMINLVFFALFIGNSSSMRYTIRTRNQIFVNHPSLRSFQKESSTRLAMSELQEKDHIESKLVGNSNESYKASLRKDVWVVAIPALIACVAEPALTLIDTLCIGKFSSPALSTIGLAGMSINGAVFNIIAALTYPLCTGTTAVVAKIKGRESEDSEDAQSNSLSKKYASTSVAKGSEVQAVLYNGIIISTTVGVLVGLLLILKSTYILQQCFGLQGPVLQASENYLKIRALSIPAAMLNYVIIGFSLGVQDAWAPIISILGAVIINTIGDYVFICNQGMGLLGAALATTMSSTLCCALALVRLISKYGDPNVNEKLNARLSGKKFTVENRVKKRSLINVAYMKAFFSASTSLLAGSLINTLIYSSGSRIVSFAKPLGSLGAGEASLLPTLHIAAHQIAMQTWWFLSFFSSPLSLVAQAVLPRDIAAKKEGRALDMMRLLIKLSVVVASATTLLNVIIPTWLPQTFTSSENVIRLFQSVTPHAAVSQFIICIATMLDGLFIGNSRLKDYVQCSLVSTVLALAVHAYSIQKGLGIVGYWNGLLVFSMSRLIYYLLKLPQLLKISTLTNASSEISLR